MSESIYGVSECLFREREAAEARARQFNQPVEIIEYAPAAPLRAEIERLRGLLGIHPEDDEPLTAENAERVALALGAERLEWRNGEYEPEWPAYRFGLRPSGGPICWLIWEPLLGCDGFTVVNHGQGEIVWLPPPQTRGQLRRLVAALRRE